MSQREYEISREEIDAAARRIAGRVRETPVLALGRGFAGLDCELWLKLEYLQHTGSFKPRGAFSLMLARQLPPAGVACASGGNFGLAVAHAAYELGVPAVVFVPDSSPAAKIARLHDYRAEVRVIAGFYADALRASEAWARSSGALLAHAYDQRELVAGQGTCARELESQLPALDTVIVAVGGGGLIGGVASWYRGSVKVVAVETHTTNTLHAALAAGEPVDVEVSGLAASALGAARVGRYAFAAARRWVAESILVSDEDLTKAQLALWDLARIIVEPAAGAPLAAICSGAYRTRPDERIALIVCGANVDPKHISSADT